MLHDALLLLVCVSGNNGFVAGGRPLKLCDLPWSCPDLLELLVGCSVKWGRGEFWTEVVRCRCPVLCWSASPPSCRMCLQLSGGKAGELLSRLGGHVDSRMFVTASLPILSLFTGKNKRVGKQLASQKILQLLHPHVKNWGSLLRMYGRESSKMVKQVTGPLSQSWSTCLGSPCHGDRIGHLCSCSWLPLLGSLLGYSVTLWGGGNPWPRGLGLSLALWRGGWRGRRCRW